MKHLLQNDDREALKVTMTGLKVFERQELKVCALVAQDITIECWLAWQWLAALPATCYLKLSEPDEHIIMTSV